MAANPWQATLRTTAPTTYCPPVKPQPLQTVWYFMVFENLSPNPAQPALSKCLTGIQGLDEITYGGLPQGRPTLICGKTGCGKTLMSLEFLVRGATLYNEPGVFIAFEESGPELAQNVASLGWDLNTLIQEKKLIVDYIAIDRTEIQETGEYDLEGLFVRIDQAIKRIQAKRVVIDTIEVLFSGLANDIIVRSELHRLFLWLKSRQVTAIITSESGRETLTRHGIEEYVSDCVISLNQRIENELATRRLQIIKYRGSYHSSNEYPFLIEQTGISVLPITSVGLDYGASTEQRSTGIERLDTMLGGNGYFRGSSLLISGTAGSGKSSLCAHLIQAAGRRGERCLYVAFEESAQQIMRNMRSIGLDLQDLVDRELLYFQALRPTFYGLEMHLVKLHQLITQLNPSIVVVDPITSLESAGSPSQVKAFLTRLTDFLKTQTITGIFSHLVPGGAPQEHTYIGISSIMDTWIVLRDHEENGERNRLLYILKSRGVKNSNQVREFHLTSQGIHLTDVYLGSSGVLTGTARSIQEAQDKIDELTRQQAIEHQQREITRKRLILEAQIQALQAEFDAQKDALENQIQQETLKSKILFEDQQKRALLRLADLSEPDSTHPDE